MMFLNRCGSTFLADFWSLGVEGDGREGGGWLHANNNTACHKNRIIYI